MMSKGGLSMSNTELKNQYTRNVAFRLALLNKSNFC